MVKITLTLVTPAVPNFIFIDVMPEAPGRIVGDAPKIRIADLTPGQIDAIAEDWRKSLHAAAARQSAAP